MQTFYSTGISGNTRTAVAAVVLALPATQVTVERAFSNLPLLITDRSASLRTTTINDILTIKLNEFQKTKASWDAMTF